MLANSLYLNVIHQGLLQMRKHMQVNFFGIEVWAGGYDCQYSLPEHQWLINVCADHELILE